MNYRGLTWDHPRGYTALTEAARRFSEEPHGDTLEWDVHSLEGFESAPIEQICADYDLVVLDHPHLGDALECGCLQPVSDAFAGTSASVDAASYVGASIPSYTVDGILWALPLDAAAQVAAYDPTRIANAPRTWNEVEELSGQLPVSLSLSGPHSLLSLYSLCSALDAPANERGRLDTSAATEAINRLCFIADRMPAKWIDLNPIDLLERISRRTDIAYCPLVYGYVNYARRPDGLAATARRVAFANAPILAGARHGSVIGGTGVAITTRSIISPTLAAHLAELVSAATQSSFIVDHDGQPSRVEAWNSEAVDARSGGFYSTTGDTLENSWVRPRFAGYTAFQTAASAVIRDAVLRRRSTSEALDDYEVLREQALTAPAVQDSFR